MYDIVPSEFRGEYVTRKAWACMTGLALMSGTAYARIGFHSHIFQVEEVSAFNFVCFNVPTHFELQSTHVIGE